MLFNHKFFHWFYYSKKGKHAFILGSGTFVWIFIFLTQAFGVGQNNFKNYFTLSFFLLMFGAIWSIVFYLSDQIIQLINRKKELSYQQDFFLWLFRIVLVVQAFYLFRLLLCEYNCIDFKEYLELWMAAFLMFFLFYIPFSLFARFKYYQYIISNPQVINNTDVRIMGESKKDILVDPVYIIFIKAEDNYVELFYTTEYIR